MKNILLSFSIIVSLLGTPTVAFAQSGSTPTAPSTRPSGSTPTATFVLVDPLGIKNFCDLVKSLLNIVLAIGVPIAVLFLVWSGFRFILARGNIAELGNARRNFYYVIIGIAIFLGAWTLASIVSATIKTLDSSGTIQFCGR